MTPRRDHQRSRVYAWENRVVAPRDPTELRFPSAQGMVDAIWSESGLRYPPKVEALPPQASRRLADATRLTLRLPASLPSWCLLHELAHAMTTTHDGCSDGHGRIFMGVYLHLLVRYLRLDWEWLLGTLHEAGIAVDTDARPVFIDA